MAQRPFAGWLGRADRRARPARTPAADPLSLLLPQGVAAILLPHLIAALSAYRTKDRAAILAAYGVGCIVLADLLSQNKAVSDWRADGLSALEILAEQSDVPEFLEGDALKVAETTAATLAQAFELSGAFREVCQMLDAAAVDLKDRKTSDRGSVALRAAMARLEAMTLSAGSDVPLAA